MSDRQDFPAEVVCRCGGCGRMFNVWVRSMNAAMELAEGEFPAACPHCGGRRSEAFDLDALHRLIAASGAASIDAAVAALAEAVGRAGDIAAIDGEALLLDIERAADELAAKAGIERSQTGSANAGGGR